jgi:hypothetical protein
MSFDLCILDAEPSIAISEASRLYQDFDIDGTTAPNQKISSLIQEITSRYPQIDDYADEDIDNCPWAVAFDVDEKCVVICISFSRVGDVVDWISEVASKHDLVCYDPQENKLRS